MEIKVMDAPLGAEVRGVDVGGSLDRDVLGRIKQALAEHLVLVFRGYDEPVANNELSAFGSSLGVLRPSIADKSRLVDYPEINLVSNVQSDGVTGTGGAGVLEWHSDLAFEPPLTVYKYILLDAVELPEGADAGGNTKYTNLYMAYEALSSERKMQIESLEVEYRLKSDLGYVEASAQTGPRKSVVHSLVQTDEGDTARRSVWPNAGIFDSQIVGWTEEASSELLSELFAHVTQEKFVYEHVWQPFDVVVWANTETMHSRDAFDGSQRRVMRHLNITPGQ